jgi:hypothetical protein
MNATYGSDVITPGATNTYRFTVKFNDGGPNGADNAFKSARVKANFDWEAVNN